VVGPGVLSFSLSLSFSRQIPVDSVLARTFPLSLSLSFFSLSQTWLGKRAPSGVIFLAEQLSPDLDLWEDGHGQGPALKLGSYRDEMMAIMPGRLFL
jgi:hypothetical protein